MNGVQLLRLGKRLIDLSREVTTSAEESSLTSAEVAILECLLQRPGSTVSLLAASTGFAQSHVSTSVAHLRDADLVTATADPRDGRVTRLRLTARARRGIRRRAGAPADAVLRAALGDERKAGKAAVLLDELAALLLTDG